jgi:protocatechuate 3,4-dioxygenase beta subunit
MPSPTRRQAMVSASSLLLIGAAERLRPTPAQTEGPFYPDKMPEDTDPDLVRVKGQVRRAGGEMLALDGRVLGLDGQPIRGARVEIWQVDSNARYLHTADASRGGRDVAFQGFGRTTVDAQGRYAFTTIRPVPYPGRTPHIHYKVYRPDGRVLTTQFVIAGDPGNARDGVYRGVRPEDRRLVEAVFRPVGDGWASTWDIVLA